MICLKCGDIGNNLQADDIIEEEYNGYEFTSVVVGHCLNCGERYMWEEVYTYVGSRNCVPIED